MVLAGCVTTQVSREEIDMTAPLRDVVARKKLALAEAIRARVLPVPVSPATRVDTLLADSAAKTLRILFSREMSFIPYRENSVTAVYDSVRSLLGPRFRGYSLSLETVGSRIEELVPNLYRSSPARIDSSRLPRPEAGLRVPVVRNLNKPFSPTGGLDSRNIVLSPSHGWMYSKDRDRWEWQRPRLFQSVEDLIPMSFVVPYLLPMLENAGASVFVPRERDIQVHQVIVDNDTRPAKGERGSYREHNGGRKLRWQKGSGPGYAPAAGQLTGNENQFVAGSFRLCPADTAGAATVRWTPDIPDDGDYFVSVTYPASDSNVTDAHYTVYHAGGATEFAVNQQVGGSTWEYLGRFRFRAGRHPESGSVLLTSKSAKAGAFVCADGVRFGGGMGMITRNGRESGRPSFTLGARYYLQSVGMPDTLVYTFTNFRDDYRDDYMSRPEYANYLKGSPFGPSKNRRVKGLGIPIDLCFSFHTDAGITHNDSTIGSLAIYSTEGADSLRVFPDSVSRLANRDLADIVQSQIVRDLHALEDPIWTRRDLWDAKYQEALRPNMPSMLLELLSHQNFLDMRYVQDPAFRFDVARAIYKGILRFLASERGKQPVVQPLPVMHMSARFTGPREVEIRWTPAVDSLEPTASPLHYIVYTRTEDRGFDNGTPVEQPRAVMPVVPGVITSFKVTAVNEGGESFPSEVLSVCQVKDARDTVLIVNGFTRVAPPAWVESNVFSGFLNIVDAGVPDGLDFSFTGTQYDFDPASAYRTNDGPGHGTSRADHEGEVRAGNTHDFAIIHGEALRACGYSFVSAGVDAITDSMVSLGQYRIIDLILGKQRRTIGEKPVVDSLHGLRFEAFPPSLRACVRDHTQRGGSIVVSGAFIGTDLFDRTPFDSAASRFGTGVLHYFWSTGHASGNGEVVSVDTQFAVFKEPIRFATAASALRYGVDSPDAIDPAGGGRTVLRYAEDRFSAATAYRGTYGVVALGFPFESIMSSGSRAELMKAILTYLRR